MGPLFQATAFAFLPFFVLPWPSPLRVINVIIIIIIVGVYALSSRNGGGWQTASAPGIAWRSDTIRPAQQVAACMSY